MGQGEILRNNVIIGYIIWYKGILCKECKVVCTVYNVQCTVGENNFW